jgi:4-hydroxybenzoate polyprenyltransferase
MNTDKPSTGGRSSTLRAYLELVRLPNLFTAMADVTMGFLYTHGEFAPGDGWTFGLLLASSTLLYAAGVVLNDVFDAQSDALQRPERPIPSGRVSLAAARRLGWALLLLGVGLTVAAALLSGVFRPGLVGVVLAGCVVFYDGYLKRTPLGPIGMGACRMLNVLLGMSVLPFGWRSEHWLAAGALGTYIVGVTWLARHEAGRPDRWQLALATVVILAGMGLLVPLPAVAEEAIFALQVEPSRWYILILILGGLTGWRCLHAVVDPYPENVRAAVRHCIHTVVILDAVACYVVRDVRGAIVVLFFLIPTVFLGRWIDAT